LLDPDWPLRCHGFAYDVMDSVDVLSYVFRVGRLVAALHTFRRCPVPKETFARSWLALQHEMLSEPKCQREGCWIDFHGFIGGSWLALENSWNRRVMDLCWIGFLGFQVSKVAWICVGFHSMDFSGRLQAAGLLKGR
jgi:hypothetical protein